MTDCLTEKDYVTRRLARGWCKPSRGDNPKHHSYKVDNYFIISNILHRAKRFISPPCCCVSREVTGFRNKWSSQGYFDGGFLACDDITMRPNVQRLIERNVKCYVTFFRLIKFKISTWVCNKVIGWLFFEYENNTQKFYDRKPWSSAFFSDWEFRVL